MEANVFSIRAALNSVSEDSEWAAIEGWDGGGVMISATPQTATTPKIEIVKVYLPKKGNTSSHCSI